MSDQIHTRRSALAWQLVWVALFVRVGAALFRKRVMKSGPAVKRRWLRRASDASEVVTGAGEVVTRAANP